MKECTKMVGGKSNLHLGEVARAVLSPSHSQAFPQQGDCFCQRVVHCFSALGSGRLSEYGQVRDSNDDKIVEEI